MATIIDFFPSSVDADSNIANAKKQVPERLQIPATTDDIVNNVAAGRNFSSQAPDLFFVSEYYGPKGFTGAIVAWENYYGATHYALYKRAKLTAAADWKRILVIDAGTLQKETAQFLPYVNSKLKIPMTSDQGYCIMDSDVTVDNVYEYKVVCGYFPSSEAFNYEVILNSKGLLRALGPLDTDTIGSAAERYLGSADYAWVLSLCTPNLQFFTDIATNQKLKVVVGNGYAYAPNDLNDIARLFTESAYYFGLAKTANNLLRYMNPVGNDAFFKAVSESFNEATSTFSFRALNTRLTAAYTYYGNIVANAQKGVGTVDFTLFDYADIVGFDSFAKLNLFILQIRTMFINVVYARKLAIDNR